MGPWAAKPEAFQALNCSPFLSISPIALTSPFPPVFSAQAPSVLCFSLPHSTAPVGTKTSRAVANGSLSSWMASLNCHWPL